MTAPKPLLVMVAPYLPDLRATTAGAYWFARYIDEMARRFDVHLLTHRSHGREALPSGLTVHWVQHVGPPRFSGVRGAGTLRELRQGVVTPAGLLPAITQDPRARELIERACVVELHWGETMPLVDWVRRCNPSARIIVMLQDVISQATDRRRRAERGLRRLLTTAQLVRARQVERKTLSAIDLLLCFSDKDVALVRALGISTAARVMPLYCDPVPPARTMRPRDTVVFVGAMGRIENADGISRFVRDSWPMVLSQEPRARLRVVGAGPHPDLVLELERAEGVDVVGWVDVLADELVDAAAFIAPLWRGAGVKYKVLMAAAYGLPIIGTSVAAEGLHDRGMPFWCLSDTPEGLAAGVVRALRDHVEAHSCGLRAREWLTEQEDFSVAIADLAALHLTQAQSASARNEQA